MSAKRAAKALVTYDLDLKATIDSLTSAGQYWYLEAGAQVAADTVLRYASKKWTLNFVAAAAGISKRHVLIALARDYLACGTQLNSTLRVNGVLRDE